MADEETKVEEVQEVAEAPPEVSIDDLRTQLTEKDSLIVERDAKIKGLRQAAAKHSERERKLTDSWDTVHKRLDAGEEQRAIMLDMLTAQGSGLEIPTQQQSYKQKLDLERAERGKTKTETPVDPAVNRFLDFVEFMGLDRNDKLVLEAVNEGNSTPQEALTHLRDKIKADEKASADIKADEKAQKLYEQKLKGNGLTSKGAGGPNAASQDDDAFIRDYSDGKSNDHERAKKILAGKK